MSAELKLSLETRLESLPVLEAALAQFGAAQKLPSVTVFALRLVLEEIFVNIVRYAFEENESAPPVQIAIAEESSGVLNVMIMDRGRPFNPLAQTAALPTYLTRSSGGFGLFLIRQKTRSPHYERLSDGGNQLRFCMDFQR